MGSVYLQLRGTCFYIDVDVVTGNLMSGLSSLLPPFKPTTSRAVPLSVFAYSRAL